MRDPLLPEKYAPAVLWGLVVALFLSLVLCSPDGPSISSHPVPDPPWTLGSPQIDDTPSTGTWTHLLGPRGSERLHTTSKDRF